MDLGLNNKLALVTGSSGGIGLAIARSLAAEGAKVAVNGRTTQSVDKAIAKIRSGVTGADLIPLVADNATAKGCATTIAELPSVDILVNNLGIYEAVGFFDESDADWMRMFETNIMSGVRLSRHYLRVMLDRGEGRVVFIASESAISPAPEMAHYSATKTMQLSISRSLAELTKNTRVTVNTVLPGSTRTESVETFLQDVFPGDLPYRCRKALHRREPPDLAAWPADRSKGDRRRGRFRLQRTRLGHQWRRDPRRWRIGAKRVLSPRSHEKSMSPNRGRAT